MVGFDESCVASHKMCSSQLSQQIASTVLSGMFDFAKTSLGIFWSLFSLSPVLL